MLGVRSPQRGLLEADHLYLEHVGHQSFYGFLTSMRGQLFKDEEFAELYCPHNGRDSVPPSLLATALLFRGSSSAYRCYCQGLCDLSRASPTIHGAVKLVSTESPCLGKGLSAGFVVPHRITPNCWLRRWLPRERHRCPSVETSCRHAFQHGRLLASPSRSTA